MGLPVSSLSVCRRDGDPVSVFPFTITNCAVNAPDQWSSPMELVVRAQSPNAQPRYQYAFQPVVRWTKSTRTFFELELQRKFPTVAGNRTVRVSISLPFRSVAKMEARPPETSNAKQRNAPLASRLRSSRLPVRVVHELFPAVGRADSCAIPCVPKVVTFPTKRVQRLHTTNASEKNCDRMCAEPVLKSCAPLPAQSCAIPSSTARTGRGKAIARHRSERARGRDELR